MTAQAGAECASEGHAVKADAKSLPCDMPKKADCADKKADCGDKKADCGDNKADCGDKKADCGDKKADCGEKPCKPAALPMPKMSCCAAK
tara:strand:+ start:6575 stop:6844 length:270 start_codon:yes stop_codon:yes gene_type:complete